MLDWLLFFVIDFWTQISTDEFVTKPSPSVGAKMEVILFLILGIKITK